ncbi:hypothetical protein Ddye_009877 [Dipteronia dyeriana]|uniref:Uncharacterized protein n=1 Tax=Dipteronia dyeriana TaxID=168575 RepID=A0AAD9XCG4_9ROSI|nr:hypothetical protein Ddye_009877 [Dipteronia dyeriana]
MGFHRRSFFTEPNPSTTTTKEYLGTSSNHAVSKVVEEENPMAQMWRTPSLKEFSFKDLKIATKNFSPDSLLGQGGFGRVYKGWVDEKTLAPSSIMGIGMAVAVKVLNHSTSLQGFQEWQSLSCVKTGLLTIEARKMIHGNCKERKDEFNRSIE